MKKLGQLFFMGIDSLSLNEREKDFISKENIGGIILFTRNYESPAQLAELVNSIQALRQEYPLFIGVDFEGGRVQRFKEGFSRYPSALEMGRRESPKTVYEIHSMMAQELKACGVNLNFSPVCDVLLNEKNKAIGDRAFARDSEVVSKLISGAIRGLQTEGLIACAKHFPGHGSTSKDSHDVLPVVKTPLDELKKNEWDPFVKAAKSRVEFFMMAHLIVDAIDETLPTSLSPKAYMYLREYCRFKKIIITDDMEMGAITEHYGLPDASLMALKAGADMLCIRSFESGVAAFERVKESFVSKLMTTEELDLKISRILDCKKRYLSSFQPIYIPDISHHLKTEQRQKIIESLLNQ